ncbi:hypothetical protein AHAS_Ahas05G0281700 [Arachis hypogaea]
MHCAISFDKFRKVLRCKSAKEISEKLLFTHGGTEQVQETCINKFMKEYKIFLMKEDEIIDEMFERFSVIMNNLDVGKETH